MKRSIIEIAALSTLFLFSTAALEGAATEKEYYGAQVLLIDPKTGSLGVEVFDDESQKSERHAFVVNKDAVDLAGAANAPIEFSDIKVGHRLDIYTETGTDGREKVTMINDIDATEAE